MIKNLGSRGVVVEAVKEGDGNLKVNDNPPKWCPTDQMTYSARVQQGVAFVAVLAAISEIVAIYRRGKDDEKQNIWTPMLLMLVKFGFMFVTWCQALQLTNSNPEDLPEVCKKFFPKKPKKPSRFDGGMFVNFTYFSKAVAYILWGITFIMVMTVQIHCGLKCDNEDKARMDLSLHALYIALVVPLAIMALIYWRFIALGKAHANPERQLIHASMTCSTLLMIGVGIVLGLASSNYFSF